MRTLHLNCLNICFVRIQAVLKSTHAEYYSGMCRFYNIMYSNKTDIQLRKRGSSGVLHLPLVLEVPGSIPAHGEKNFGVRTRFL